MDYSDARLKTRFKTKEKSHAYKRIKASSVSSGGQANKDNGQTVVRGGHSVHIPGQSCDFKNHMMSSEALDVRCGNQTVKSRSICLNSFSGVNFYHNFLRNNK